MDRVGGGLKYHVKSQINGSFKYREKPSWVGEFIEYREKAQSEGWVNGIRKFCVIYCLGSGQAVLKYSMQLH